MKWLHNLLKGLSLTAALFVVQACYGTPPGWPDEFELPPAAEQVEASGQSQDLAALPAEELSETGTPEPEVVE